MVLEINNMTTKKKLSIKNRPEDYNECAILNKCDGVLGRCPYEEQAIKQRLKRKQKLLNKI